MTTLRGGPGYRAGGTSFANLEAMRALYRRLPENLRHVLHPFNMLDEAASFLPGRPRRTLRTIAEAGRRLQRLRTTRYAVRLVSGQAAGSAEPLTALLVMDDHSAGYWKGELFSQSPSEEQLGDVRALAVPAAAGRLSSSADLSLWQTPWPVRGRACGARVPSWVPLSLATECPLDDIVSGERSGRAARKNDVRRVTRLGLTTRVVTDRDAYERFREELYLPYVRWRFDELAIPIAPHVFRQAQRHATLLLLERDGRSVGGALLDRGGEEAAVVVFGVARDGPVPAGPALEACYYHAIRFAVEQGFRRLSLGACRPVLSDGVLRYKRKWGARIDTPTTWDAFGLRYRHTPAVRAALTAAPVVIDCGHGRLAALVGVAGAARQDLAAHVESVEARGLAELACLVERDVQVPARPAARHTSLRIVPPGDVWPPEARVPVTARMLAEVA